MIFIIVRKYNIMDDTMLLLFYSALRMSRNCGYSSGYEKVVTNKYRNALPCSYMILTNYMFISRIILYVRAYSVISTNNNT